MRAAILAVGSELLGEDRAETNSLWLARLLADHGVELVRKVAVADQEEAIAAEIARGVGSGRPAEALLAAIGRCGELLREKRLAARPDDQNELPDGLRVLPG